MSSNGENHTTLSLKNAMKAFEGELENWAGKQASQVNKLHSQHCLSLQESSSTIQEMKREERALQELSQNQQRQAGEEDRKTQDMQTEIGALKEQAEALPHALQTLKADGLLIKHQAESQLNKLQSLRQESSYQLSEISKGTDFFKQKLGLELSTQDGKLAITLTKLDPLDPCRPFTLQLVVDSQNHYQLVACQPPLREAQTLLEGYVRMHILYPLVLCI